MQKCSLAILGGAGLIVASVFISLMSRPAVAQTPQSTAVFQPDGKLNVANRISQMGFRRRPFDAQRAEQWKSRIPGISQRLHRSEKRRCVPEDGFFSRGNGDH